MPTVRFGYQLALLAWVMFSLQLLILPLLRNGNVTALCTQGAHHPSVDPSSDVPQAPFW